MEEKMLDKNMKKQENKKKDIALKVLLIFSVILVLVCFFVFIFNYERALDDSGDWFPNSFTVQVYYFFIAVGAIVVAAFLKLIYGKGVSFSALLVVCIILPTICYHSNRFTLDKGGPLSFLVEEGGIFHFITIGDFNFDGVNDKTYDLMNNIRTESSWDTGHWEDKIIKDIKVKTTGKGIHLNTFTTHDESKGIIEFHLRADGAEYEKIEWDIVFFDKRKADNFSMTPAFIRRWGSDEPLGFKLNYDISRTSDTNIKVVFDKEDCFVIQNHSTQDYITVSFKYNG